MTSLTIIIMLVVGFLLFNAGWIRGTVVTDRQWVRYLRKNKYKVPKANRWNK